MYVITGKYESRGRLQSDKLLELLPAVLESIGAKIVVVEVIQLVVVDLFEQHAHQLQLLPF